MASIEQRLLKLEVAGAPRLRAMNDTERAVRLHWILSQPGHPNRQALLAFMQESMAKDEIQVGNA